MKRRTLPRIRVPVLYVPKALEEFRAAVRQEPRYEGELVDGYIAATIRNRPDTWRTLLALRGRGIVWISDSDLNRYGP